MFALDLGELLWLWLALWISCNWKSDVMVFDQGGKQASPRAGVKLPSAMPGLTQASAMRPWHTFPPHLLSEPPRPLSSKNPMTENTNTCVISKHQAQPLTEN